jgi:hypothetical protein
MMFYNHLLRLQLLEILNHLHLQRLLNNLLDLDQILVMYKFLML